MLESKHQFIVTMIFKQLKWILYLIHFVLVVAIAIFIVFTFMFGAEETLKILNIKH
jgi:hypothetical protein